ncbi:MAG: hypothetical protein ACREB3_06725, partial [Burkholderiales bacterium]
CKEWNEFSLTLSLSRWRGDALRHRVGIRVVAGFVTAAGDFDWLPFRMALPRILGNEILRSEAMNRRKTSNIQRPTSNFQWPPAGQPLVVGCSMLDVGCWMFLRACLKKAVAQVSDRI